jgi:hypothetical protein
MMASYTSAAFTNVAGVANVAASASIEVRREDTGALAAIFADRDGAAPLGNPFLADAGGRFQFFAAGIKKGYQVKATKDAFVITVHDQAVGLAGQLDALDFGASLLTAADQSSALTALASQRLERAARRARLYAAQNLA